MFQDERSIMFGVGRISTAALFNASLIHGYEPSTFKNIDFNQTDESAFWKKIVLFLFFFSH